MQNIIVKRALSDSELEDLHALLYDYFVQHISLDEFGWNVVLMARQATRRKNIAEIVEEQFPKAEKPTQSRKPGLFG